MMEDNYKVTVKGNRDKPAVYESTSPRAVARWLYTRSYPSNWEVRIEGSKVYIGGDDFIKMMRYDGDDLVPQNYILNLDTERRIADGSKLKNGMEVLVSGSSWRTSIPESMIFETLEDEGRARTTNRWCTISQVRIDDGRVIFLATYADGVRKMRKYPLEVPWLVKLNDHEREFVPKFYQMDPETEDVIFTHDLQNGMVVLTSDPDRRMSLEDLDEDWKVERARRWNRWCRVSQFTTVSSAGAFLFVGVYSDGTKRLFNTMRNDFETWYVKKDSFPRKDFLKDREGPDEDWGDIEPRVRKIVREEMLELLKSMRNASENLKEMEPYDKKVDEIAFNCISDVLKDEIAHLPCAWNCELRENRYFEGEPKCTCGAKR